MRAVRRYLFDPPTTAVPEDVTNVSVNERDVAFRAFMYSHIYVYARLSIIMCMK